MSDVMCMNHPEWPAEPTGADYGPPLCASCARAAGPDDVGPALLPASLAEVGAS